MTQEVLHNLPQLVAVPDYERQAIRSSVVHLGVGNFHRAHQASYFDDLLNAGHREWGITGVSLRSPKTRDALEPQDYLYTLVEQANTNKYRIIGALQSVLVAPEEPQAVIDRMASGGTELITVTVTEKGYLLDGERVDLDHPLMQADLAMSDRPVTVYGLLATTLARRASSGAGPITVLCCDNVTNGGAILREGTTHLLKTQKQVDANWLEGHVSFASSVVDRVTPSTTPELVSTTEGVIGSRDAWPVATEPYRMWVIENNFAGKRPPLDAVGAFFVPDVMSFERMKLACLNAAHSVLAALGYLLSLRYVHEAVTNKLLCSFVKDTIRNEVLPITEIPAMIDGPTYVDKVFERFANAALPYKNTQVCTDSSQKIRQRWFPTIDLAIDSGSTWNRLALVVATWVAAVSKMSLEGDVTDPSRDELTRAVRHGSSSRDKVSGALAVAGAETFSFWAHRVFLDRVVTAYDIIVERGIEASVAAEQSGMIEREQVNA